MRLRTDARSNNCSKYLPDDIVSFVRSRSESSMGDCDSRVEVAARERSSD
jgi:hypothetical protein